MIDAVLGKIAGDALRIAAVDLAISCKAIGLCRLSALLEQIFRDDIRNCISHADYIIWKVELCLRKRNGGNPLRLSMAEVNAAINQGIAFFQILREYNSKSARSFDPEKTIVGRLSASFPAPWTVCYNPHYGTFSISGSSPGAQTTPDYERQVAINNFLGGKVLATFSAVATNAQEIESHIEEAGFEPNEVLLKAEQLSALLADIERFGLWDKKSDSRGGCLLLASPWGFQWLSTPQDFDGLVAKPLLDFEVDQAATNPIGG